ncbi:halocarboxylic acid dehydrogenase DehI family protein [Haloglomus litoreum]|uniref:halocarboxylic acid dehydrogenase DehI family protein n=1 Tax=Haloglomus litoreum TaxID=3034026 RepID=UPI0023E82412|nr:halocarboxylic acid dehydrogenase DehI family protein [Haloglomus sp. DT116]
MDPTRQLHLAEATGWRRGLYEDVMATFRASIVNSIWRTLVANRPCAARHLWTAVKPTFQTRAFADFSVRYRDDVLAALETADEGSSTESPTLPAYDSGDVDLSPAAFAALRGQLATFDIVAPRLAALFAVCDRALSEGFDGAREGHAATAPAPEWLDADRGARVTVIDSDAAREAAPDTVEAIEEYHATAFLPSIYRCLAQWPSYLETVWADTAPLREVDGDAGFDAARQAADEVVASFAERPPVPVAVTTDGLAAAGVADPDDALADLRNTFAAFAAGASGVLPFLHAYAATVDATGERGWRLAD